MSNPPAIVNAGELVERVRQRTPARVLVGRSGASYLTTTALTLRADHASARDAVWAEVRPDVDFPELDLFSVSTRAGDKQEYLLRPDLGRQLNGEARATVVERCPKDVDLQIVVGDGLSAAAVKAQVPGLIPLLLSQAKQIGWSVGVPFFVRFCRVGVLNDVGELLDPAVVVLLIGERPGLATAESLSAYLAYRPRAGDTDAKRNLISNVHQRGLTIDEAARRIMNLVALLKEARASGFQIKERLLREMMASLPLIPQDEIQSR